jgi:hypothetical protein
MRASKLWVHRICWLAYLVLVAIIIIIIVMIRIGEEEDGLVDMRHRINMR